MKSPGRQGLKSLQVSGVPVCAFVFCASLAFLWSRKENVFFFFYEKSNPQRISWTYFTKKEYKATQYYWNLSFVCLFWKQLTQQTLKIFIWGRVCCLKWHLSDPEFGMCSRSKNANWLTFPGREICSKRVTEESF